MSRSHEARAISGLPCARRHDHEQAEPGHGCGLCIRQMVCRLEGSFSSP